MGNNAQSIEQAVAQLESRGVTGAKTLVGQLLCSVIAPVVSKYDHDRETKDIGPAILVTNLKAAVKSPSTRRRDAKIAYVNAQGRYREWTDTFYDWPEGWVIRACFRLEQEGKELCSAAIKKELPPSPLEVAS